MKLGSWITHLAKLAIVIITITATTTTSYSDISPNSYKPMDDVAATNFLIKRDYGDIPGVLRFGKRYRGADQLYKNFQPNSILLDEDGYGKRSIPGVMRFGKRQGDIPGMLRFGKRDDYMPGVLRFGKRSDSNSLQFDKRYSDTPGVLRFG